MTTTTLTPPVSIFLQSLVGIFKRPPRLQIAALCYRKSRKGLEVLLVTSRGTGRWILPKGWPELKEAGHETAETEAYEEAGIVGSAESKPFAHFRSYKGMDGGLNLRTRVDVYLIKAEDQIADFPELGQRTIAWVPVDKAIEMTGEPELHRVLKRLEAHIKHR
ncbi:NUDIX hydrolase [uncultured Roseibium sp.]|uniref:NUDIX hydrolase n=1 Tax=uncultured Roseibium sp. TaxID=1936171 RepID=UPI003216E2A4